MAVFFILIEEYCVIIEKHIDKKLANRIRYQIWNDAWKESLVRGPDLRRRAHIRQRIWTGAPYPLADFDRGSKSAVTPARLSLVCYLTVPKMFTLNFIFSKSYGQWALVER